MLSSSVTSKQDAWGSLRYFARQRAPIERCEMCSRELCTGHQHLIEPEKHKLVCACDACALLFSEQPGTKLRRVPRRIRFLPAFQLNDLQWNRLMIPIELAFFFKSSVHARVVAFYPGPAGATESLLSLEGWDELVKDNPVLNDMTPDVEALLVNRVGTSHGVPPQYYVVPIDACYRLVGLIRLHWHGLSGGTEMWRNITSYFSSLRDNAEAPSETADA